MSDDDDISTMLCDSATSWLAGRHSLARMRSEVGEPRPVDRDCWREMAELGWLGLLLPEDVDGAGLGLAEASALSELFGKSLLPEPFIAAAVLPGTIIAAASGEPQAELAAEMASGDKVLTLAWQAQVNQLDPTPAGVVLKGDALSGKLRFVPAVEEDGVLLVSAANDKGEPVVVVVDAAASGVAIERSAAGNGTSVASIGFDNAPIRFGAPLLSGPAAVEALSLALERGRVAAAAQLTGVAAGALAMTLDYVGQRKQFDRTIASFQVTQHRCVDLHIAVMLAGATFRHAARCDASALSVEAAAAKARGGDTAMQVCRMSIQLHGGIGFTHEADIGLFMRTAMYYMSWLGTPESLRRRFMAGISNKELTHV